MRRTTLKAFGVASGGLALAAALLHGSASPWAAAASAASPARADAASPGSPVSPASGAPVSEKVLQYLSFTSAEEDALRKGEIVSHAVDELSDKELAITMAVSVPAPLTDLLDFLRSGRALEIDRDILAHGVVPIDASGRFDAAAFAGVVLDPSEAKEIRRLLETGPGSSYNLSEREFRAFARLRQAFPAKECGTDPKCADAVVSALRKVLQDRLAAYLDRGLAGVDAYVRDGDERADPAGELRQATGAAHFLEQWNPQVFEAFRDFPKGDQTGIENRFLWLKQTIQDRPTFILSHRVLCVRDGIAFAAERQFYVGHSYNSQQILVGLVPMEGKTLIVYLNRTSTDQVAGFMKGTRHGVGRKMMEKGVREQFEEVRADVAGGR